MDAFVEIVFDNSDNRLPVRIMTAPFVSNEPSSPFTTGGSTPFA